LTTGMVRVISTRSSGEGDLDTLVGADVHDLRMRRHRLRRAAVVRHLHDDTAGGDGGGIVVQQYGYLHRRPVGERQRVHPQADDAQVRQLLLRRRRGGANARRAGPPGQGSQE